MAVVRFGWAGVRQGSMRVSGLAQTHTCLWLPRQVAFASLGLLLPTHGLPRPKQGDRGSDIPVLGIVLKTLDRPITKASISAERPEWSRME